MSHLYCVGWNVKPYSLTHLYALCKAARLCCGVLKLKYTSRMLFLQVCKMFLCGFCPNELFVNTRSDLGTCHKIHDDELTKK